VDPEILGADRSRSFQRRILYRVLLLEVHQYSPRVTGARLARSVKMKKKLTLNKSRNWRTLWPVPDLFYVAEIE
jgi:hypothetical protein